MNNSPLCLLILEKVTQSIQCCLIPLTPLIGEEGNDEDGSIVRASLETSSSQQSYRRGTDCSFLAKEVKSYRDLYLIYEETRRPMKDELLSLKCRDAFDVLSRREELVCAMLLQLFRL